MLQALEVLDVFKDLAGKAVSRPHESTYDIKQILQLFA